MTYTIIRPGGLNNAPATGAGVLTADARVCGAVGREDVAELVTKAALSAKTDNMTLSAVDRGQLFKKDGEDPVFDDFAL